MKVTHQCIAFDKDGNLIDGQHRLAAVLQTRQTVKMTVATNMDQASLMLLILVQNDLLVML